MLLAKVIFSVAVGFISVEGACNVDTMTYNNATSCLSLDPCDGVYIMKMMGGMEDFVPCVLDADTGLCNMDLSCVGTEPPTVSPTFAPSATPTLAPVIKKTECTDFATEEACLGEVIGCEWIQEIADRFSDKPACHLSGSNWCYLWQNKNACKSISKCEYDSRESRENSCKLIPDDGCGGLVKGECNLHSNCVWTDECVSLKNNPCAAGWGKRKACSDIPGCSFSNKQCVEAADDPLNMECTDIRDKKSCKSNERCTWKGTHCEGPRKERQCTYNDLILQLPAYTLDIEAAVGSAEKAVLGYDGADATCLCFEYCLDISQEDDPYMFWNVEFIEEYLGFCTCYTETYDQFRVRNTKKDMVCGGMTLEAHAVVEAAAP